MNRPDIGMDPLDEATAGTLRMALLDASRTIDADGGLPVRATAGGRARLRRRRTGAAGAAIIAVTAVVGAVVLAPSGLDALRADRSADDPAQRVTRAGQLPTYEQLLSRPTSGDRAADAGFLASARTAWDGFVALSDPLNAFGAELPDPEPAGDAHVVWAGTSPTGPAAMLVQKVVVPAHRSDSGDHPRAERFIAGFVGSGVEGDLVVTGAHLSKTAGDERVAWFTDDARTTIAVLGLGSTARLSWNTGLRYADDGSVRTSSATNLVDGEDVTFLRPDPDVDVESVQVLASGTDRLGLLGGDEVTNQSGWAGNRPATLSVAGMSRVDAGGQEAERARRLIAEADARSDAALPVRRTEPWYVAGRAADGTVHALYSAKYGRELAQVYLVTLGEDPADDRLRHIGPAPQDLAAPVAVPLPDGLGTLVVRPGSAISWGTGKGWTSVGRDAALVPARATQLRIRDAELGDEFYPVAKLSLTR